MIGEVSLLMTAGLKLWNLAGTIHCYPTQVEVLKRLGDQYNKTRLTPRAAWLLAVDHRLANDNCLEFKFKFQSWRTRFTLNLNL